MVQHVGHDADRIAGGGDDTEPDELMVVKLVGIGQRRDLRRIQDEQRAAQALGGGPVTDTLERDDEPPRMPPGRGHRQRPALRRFRGQHRPRGETGAGFIGPHRDEDFAADAMRPDDLADGNLHARVPG